MAEVAIVLLVVFAVLLLINVPVAVAIGVASLVAVFANGGAVQPEMIVADRMINGVASFSLLAIPFFVLSGILMGRGGMARRLIDFLSGVAYAGEGKIKKVAANTYIITPYSVDIMGDLIDELENNGLYF